MMPTPDHSNTDVTAIAFAIREFARASSLMATGWRTKNVKRSAAARKDTASEAISGMPVTNIAMTGEEQQALTRA